MRLTAQNPVSLRNRILGSHKPLLCVPVASRDEASLLSEMEKVMHLCPDVLEWRADFFEGVEDAKKVKKVLEKVRKRAGEVPIIFTCRSHEEGGFRKIDQDVRLELMGEVIATGKIDAVDLELAAGKIDIDNIKVLAKKNNVALILSYHNFIETPPVEFILKKIEQEVSMGADVAKIAVMPKSEEDVINIMRATLMARRQIANPLITVAMGNLGAVTRAAGWLFGSDLTFAAGINASAPGQMPLEELRTAIDILQRVEQRK